MPPSSVPLAGAPPLVGGSAAPSLVPDPVTPPSATPANPDCDLSGSWIAQHITRNAAFGVVQVATNWQYHRIVQQGTRFSVMESIDCGFVVRGSTDVALSDATLEGVAVRSLNATGVSGTFAPSADGQRCALRFDRAYTIRGANRERFLEASWKVGDPPKDLREFTLPTGPDDGMEDWDQDGHAGVTQSTGFGDRYSAQLDWYAIVGEAPKRASHFGGEGALSLEYDLRESIAPETPPLLQTFGTPMPPGYAWLTRIDGEYDGFALGPSARLQVCKKIQALAIAKFGDPPRQ
jgi:hypothetical protein